MEPPYLHQTSRTNKYFFCPLWKWYWTGQWACSNRIRAEPPIGEKEVSLQEIRSGFEFVPGLFGIVLRARYFYCAWPRTVLILIAFKFIVPEFDNLSCSVPVKFSPKDLNLLKIFPYSESSWPVFVEFRLVWECWAWELKPGLSL